MRKLKTTGKKIFDTGGFFAEAVEYPPQKRIIMYQGKKYLSFPYLQFYLLDCHGKTLYLTASEQPATLNNIKILPLPHLDSTGAMCMYGISNGNLEQAITKFWNTTFSYMIDPRLYYPFTDWVKGGELKLQRIYYTRLNLKTEINPFETIVYE